MICRYELYVINENLDDIHNKCFLPSEYSRFKHGDLIIARKYGYQLAEMFIKLYDKCLLHCHDEFIVANVAYTHAPTASLYAFKWFCERIDVYMKRNHLGPIEKIRFTLHKSMNSNDYSSITSKDMRLAVCVSDDTRVSADRDRLEGKKIVIIDDLRITGTFEQLHMDYLYKNVNLYEVVYLYIANVIDYTMADIEHKLNKYEIKSLDDIAKMTASDFGITSRVCRDVLQHENLEELLFFLNQISTSVLYDLYQASLFNGLYSIEEFSKNFSIIESQLTTKNVLALQ